MTMTQAPQGPQTTMHPYPLLPARGVMDANLKSIDTFVACQTTLKHATDGTSSVDAPNGAETKCDASVADFAELKREGTSLLIMHTTNKFRTWYKCFDEIGAECIFTALSCTKPKG